MLDATRTLLVSVIAQNAANADAVVLNKALIAANYSLELFCDAVSIAKSNETNDTIYSLFRSGLDLDAFKKVMEVEVAKNPEATFWELCESLRRSPEATSNASALVFPGAVFNKIGTLGATVAVSVHAVMSGIICTDDRAATVVPGSGKLVAAGTGAAITFCNEDDAFLSASTCLPNTERCVSHWTHAKAMNASEGAGSGKTYVKDALHTFTVSGLRSITSLGHFYRFKQQQTNVTESELNTVFGWDRDGAVMPETENITDSSALQFVVRNETTGNTSANTGVVGNGIYVSVFTATNATIAATYQAANGAANKTKAQVANSYTNAAFYSGMPEARDILQALHKSWTSKQIVACGFEYNDIKNAGFNIKLSDFVDDKTPSGFMSSVLGYVDTSGVISYNNVKVRYTEVLSKLKEAGYSLLDLKNDGTTKTMLQAFDATNVAGSGWAAAMSVYADQVTLKDRVSQFDNYSNLAATVGASTFTNAAGYTDNSERYFRPLKEVFGKFTKASEFIDALVELNDAGLSFTALPSVGTGTTDLKVGGYFPSSYTQRQLIEADLTLLHGNATSSTESVFKNYILALAQHVDMEGVAKIRQQFCYWDEPANYNVNNSGDMKFRSAIGTYVASDLPTASYYALYGVGQQQYIQEAAGASYSISGKSWAQYYQSENRNGPHKKYATALKVMGVSPAAAIAYVIPNTKTAAQWVTTGIGHELAEALTDGMYGWPSNIRQASSAGNALDKPWAGTSVNLDQPMGSEYVFEGTASVVGNTHNLHLLLHADGYGYSVADFLSSPYANTSISGGAAAGTGSFAWSGDAIDYATSRVFNVALYASLAQGPQYGVMKQLLALDADRVALIFKEGQAAATLTSAQRASILTHSFNTDTLTGDKLFDMIKSNASDSDNLDIGTVIVAHLNAAAGGNILSGADLSAQTFLSVQASVEDLSRHIMDYPGQIYAAMIDVSDANQKENDIEVFAAAIMKLSEDDLVKFAANAKKWNTTAGRAEADMVNYNNLQGVVIPFYAKSEKLANGLVVEYEAGVSRLPVALLNKLKSLL
jgi:hypothetical protein